MTFAHLMGVPVEESALSLTPAGAAIAVFARFKLARIFERRRRRRPGR